MLNTSGEIFSTSRVPHTTQRPPPEWPTLQSLLRDIAIEPLADEWIGWSDEQRCRRLPLLANNSRFLLLPDQPSPNLGSAVLSRATSRSGGDWMERYGHPVHTLLGIMAAAHLAAAPRGQQDLEVFARSLSQQQRKALGVRRDPKTRRFDSPDQTTFNRLMSPQVDAAIVESVLIDWQARLRGPVPAGETVVIDGKQPKHAGGHNVVTAITSPSQHYLGCELVADQSNEIPAARELIARLDLDGKLVSLDALHSCQQTAREIVLEAGADYSLTIKDNCPPLRERIEARLPDPGSPLLPWQNTPAAPPATAARKRNANG